jgi:hypothetical protein
MKIVSTAALTMISALSAYSSETLAPLPRWRLTQKVLSIYPYLCITLALIGVALSFCASKSKGLAECASFAVLLVCLSGIWLGVPTVAVILHATGIMILFWIYVLSITLICAWGRI